MQSTIKTTQKHDNKVQKLADNFFSNKCEQTFTPLYKEINNIVNSVAPSIVKFDKDKIITIVSDIAMTVWNGTNANGEEIYSEDKSFLSWVYISAKNKAIQHYKKNKNRREIFESDMSFDGDEDSNRFDTLSHSAGHYDEMTNTDSIENDLFHKNPKKQVAFIEEKLRDMYEGEEFVVLYKAIIKQVSPQVIADEHGINSRITVSTRASRVRSKISTMLEDEIRKSLMKENKTIDGDFDYKKGGQEVRCSREKGLLHGEWKSYYENGSPKIEGQYKNGQKVGEWKTYYENGIVESVINYSDATLPYMLFDRYGYEEAVGVLN